MSTLAIGDGMVVSFHYTLKDPSGEVLDSSSGADPLSYLHGASNIVPGLEREMSGHGVGDQFAVVVKPEEGYGVRREPGPQAVPRGRFPAGMELQPGMPLHVEDDEGQPFVLWVVEVASEHVMIDHNHPLAGVTLHFDVEVTEVRKATAEEMEHGHPHGPGGAHH